MSPKVKTYIWTVVGLNINTLLCVIDNWEVSGLTGFQSRKLKDCSLIYLAQIVKETCLIYMVY